MRALCKLGVNVMARGLCVQGRERSGSPGSARQQVINLLARFRRGGDLQKVPSDKESLLLMASSFHVWAGQEKGHPPFQKDWRVFYWIPSWGKDSM